MWAGRKVQILNTRCAKLHVFSCSPIAMTNVQRIKGNDSRAVRWWVHPRHPLRSQPGVSLSDGNSSVSRHQQITFRATLIFYLIDGLLCTTAAHEVRRAGVLTCGSCHLERSARPHPHRGWSCQVPKTAEITQFSSSFNTCWFLCFSRCFSIWLTFVMHLWPWFF